MTTGDCYRQSCLCKYLSPRLGVKHREWYQSSNESIERHRNAKTVPLVGIQMTLEFENTSNNRVKVGIEPLCSPAAHIWQHQTLGQVLTARPANHQGSGQVAIWVCVIGVPGQNEGFTGPLPHRHVKISCHHIVSSHCVRWRSSGNYTHLHVLIWLISRNKHFPMTPTTRWATHLQKLW